MSGVNFNERVFVVGPTESGKSTLLNVLFSEMRCQRLLFDSKGHEWTIEGVEPVWTAAELDWSEPILHYCLRDSEDLGEVAALFRQCNQRQGGLVVCVHELQDLCAYVTQRTPGSVNTYVSQGGANGRGFLGGTQEPVDMPKRARAEIQHVYTMVPPIDGKHMENVARVVPGVSASEMTAEIEDVERELGAHAFIHWPRGVHQEPTRWAHSPTG